MTRRLGLFLLLILLLGLTLGCGMSGLIGGEEEEAPPSVAKVEKTEEVAEVGETEEVAEVEEIEEAEEKENISLSSITSGLQSLDSYRSHFEMIFESSTGDEERRWVMEIDTESVSDPYAQRIVFRGDEVGLGEGFESVQIGDQQYVVFGQDQCISSSAEGSGAMDLELFELEDVFGELENAHRVRPDETVNDILCRHYVFDEKGMSWATFTHAEGEVWVAVDGDYVVKYTMEAEGKNPITGDEGHIEWEYEMRGVNEPIIIEPPSGCEAAESEFPIMPDATNMATFGDMVSYESNSSFDDVLAFYQEQMPAGGWSDTGGSFITSGSAMLSYTKDGRTVTVTLTDAGGKVSVIIMSE